MKIKFIYPKFDKFLTTHPVLKEFPHAAGLWDYTMPPSQAIPVLAALTPDHIEWHIQDQNVEPINFDDDSDLIAISFFSPQAGYAYELGEQFLKRNKTVVMGGMHPSMAPELTAGYCSALCIGEGDLLWPVILEDFEKGTLKKVYKNETFPAPGQIASPHTNCFKDQYNWDSSLLSVARGCPFKCEWCNIPVYQGTKIRYKPIENVIKEIKSLKGKEFYITDDFIMLNYPDITNYMINLCNTITRENLDIKIFLSCSPAMSANKTFLQSIVNAGATNIYMVFAGDPVSRMFYAKDRKIWEKVADLKKFFHDRGVRFFGSFGVGFDTMKEDQFDLILEFCEKNHVKTAEFFIATPFPGTPFWDRVKAEDRLLLPVDWKKFNCANVVFEPKFTTGQQLLDGFLHLWKTFYTNVDYKESLTSFTFDDDKNKSLSGQTGPSKV